MIKVINSIEINRIKGGKQVSAQFQTAFLRVTLPREFMFSTPFSDYSETIQTR